MANYARIIASLDVVPLKPKDMLQKPGQPIQHVFFPAGGYVSVLTVLEDGSMVEVATIGREGMVGAFAATDHATPPASATLVQGESDQWRTTYGKRRVLPGARDHREPRTTRSYFV